MRMYLADYIGSGTEQDPFRPAGSDIPGWSAIDLRGDATRADSGKAFLLLPEASTTKGLYDLGDDPDAALPTQVRQGVEDRLGIARGELPDTVRGKKPDEKVASGASLLADLLTLQADDARSDRPNVLRAERDGFLRIYLGGKPWWEKAVPAGGATFTDDFNRAGEDLDASADWDLVAGTIIVEDNKATPTASVESYVRATADFTDDHYAQALSDAGSSGGGTGILARCNVPGTDDAANSTFYMFRFFNGNVQLYKRVTGSFTLLDSTSGTYAEVVERIECEGSTIRGIRDSTTIFTETDGSIASGARTGLRSTSGGATWDDFEAGDITAGPGTPLLRTANGYLRTASGVLRPA